MKSPSRIHATVAQLAFLGASCLLFSLVELSIPKFVPFFRLGLSNLTLMLGLFVGLDGVSYSLLLLIKLLAQAAASGTMFSYIFVLSVASTVSSGYLMYAIYYLFRSSPGSPTFLGISAAGAFASNTAQCLVATLFLGRDALVLFVPVAGIGLVTSVLLGLIANAFAAKSHFPEVFRNSLPIEAPASSSGCSKCSPALAIIAMALFVIVMFFDNLWYRAGVLAASLVCIKILKQKIHIMRTVIMVAAVALLSLLSPYGKVLFSIGKFNITLGALTSGLGKGILLSSTISLSRIIMHCLKLKKRGMLLSSIFGYVGVLSEEFTRKRKAKGVIEAADDALIKAYSGVDVDLKPVL
ncbi:MAG: Gx transporter family protein [Sphaerochaetaceae bacterium]|nr:Gx transporter family protein [Sphaerochaetaceae bacterium]